MFLLPVAAQLQCIAAAIKLANSLFTINAQLQLQYDDDNDDDE